VSDGDPSSPRGPLTDGPDHIVLHSSWSGIAFSTVGTLLLVALAVFALASVGVTAVSVVLTIAALVVVAVIVLDMPIAADFDCDGVTRRALARHDRLLWDDVDRLSRARTGWFRSSKMAPTGGLIAVRGRRNITLVDRMEGHVEFRRLRSVLGTQGERLGVERIAEPPLEQAPTWMHRRARWAPDQAGER
jgi:hypothetical protein